MLLIVPKCLSPALGMNHQCDGCQDQVQDDQDYHHHLDPAHELCLFKDEQFVAGLLFLAMLI